MRTTRFWEGAVATLGTFVGAAYVFMLISAGQPLGTRLTPPELAAVPDTAATPEPRSLLRMTPGPISEPTPTPSPPPTAAPPPTPEPQPDPPRVAIVTPIPIIAPARIPTPAPACAAPRLSTWSVNGARSTTTFDVGDSAYARFCVPRVASRITFWVRGPQSNGFFSSRGTWTDRSEVVTPSVAFSGPESVGSWTFRLIADGVGYDARLTVRAAPASPTPTPTPATPTPTSRPTASPKAP
jgi:hypothetical protein